MTETRTDAPDILCIGGALWDMLGHSPAPLAPGEDRPGRILRRPGGVALNLALALAAQGSRPALLSAVGRDAAGEELVALCRGAGVATHWLHRPEEMPTDQYLAIEAGGALVAAIADARTLETAGARILSPLADGRLGSATAPWRGPIVLDGNLSEPLLAQIAGSALFAAADLRIVPASLGKAGRLAALVGHPRATLYLNIAEAAALCGRPVAGAADAAAALVERGARRVLVTDGARPCADAAEDGLLIRLPPPVPVARVTGAGDRFAAAHLAAELKGQPREAALEAALAAAAAHVAGDAA